MGASNLVVAEHRTIELQVSYLLDIKHNKCIIIIICDKPVKHNQKRLKCSSG